MRYSETAGLVVFMGGLPFMTLGQMQQTLSVVAEGVDVQARYEQAAWDTHAEGGLYSLETANVLYADSTVGSGDFRVEAVLAVDDLGDTEAAFVLNEYNFFGFSGFQKRFYTEGRMFGTRILAERAGELIAPGVPFVFLAERIGDLFQVSINGQLICSMPFDWRWGGEFGFRCLRVHDFSVTANFVPLEEYVFNSPQYGGDAGPLDFSMVVLPEETNLVDNNWHFGWPVVAKAGDAMIVAFQRSPHHSGSARPGFPSRSTAMVVRSIDGGENWSNPFDLSSVVTTAATNIPGSMRAICTSSAGTVIYMCDKGVFRSEDDGLSWIHYPNAIPSIDKTGVINHGLGPKILEDSTGRLIAFSHVVLSGGFYPNRMWLWESTDDGRSWSHREVELPEGVHALEPSGCLVDGVLYFLGRYHDPENAFDSETGLYSMTQIAVPVGAWSQAVARVTNIHTTDAVDVLTPLCGEDKARSFGFWSQDTPGLSYNPVTGRLEALVTNRTGGGEDAEQDITKQTLNLWSIDPADFRTGSAVWRFEATLLQRYAMDVPKFFDGMHPSGSVIDEENGKQHIFIYAGYYHGPSGIFKITRPLETPAVEQWWDSVEEINTQEENMKARQYYAALGAVVAFTNIVAAELLTEGMVLHVHSEDVRVWSGSGKVARMVDQSGNGNDVYSQSVNDGPTIQSNSLNGIDTLYIGGTTEGLRIVATNAADLNVTTNGLTMFAVFKTPYNGGYVIRKGNDSSSTEVGYSIFTDSTSGGRIHSRVADDTGIRQGTTLTTSSSDFVVYGMIIDPQSGSMNSLYNGELMASWFSDGSITNTVTSLEDFGIGNNANAAGMELAELVVYERVLENEEWNDVGFQLGRKYDIPTTYDPYPLDVIHGSILHVDAEHVGVWSLNGQVARMDDLSSSGNDNDLDAQTVNEGPVIQQEALNGYDTLRIDGTANGLRLLGAEASDLNVTTNGLTMFAVFSTPYNGGFVVRKGNDNSSSEEGYSIFTDSVSGGRIHSRVADASGTRQATTLTTTNAAFVVYGMLIDPQSGTMTSIYNGEEMDSWVNDGLLSGAISTSEDFGVGNNANAAGMQLAEMVVYDRVLTSNEWNRVGYLLGEKYAIVNTYEEGVPTGSIDGIPKAWILDQFGTTKWFSSSANPDSDWMTNAEEYQADTNPNSGDSSLDVTGLDYAGGIASLYYRNGGTNADVFIEYRPSLSSGDWIAIATNAAPAAVSNMYNHGTGDSSAFYRVRAGRND